MLILILLLSVAAFALSANEAATNICNTSLEAGRCRAIHIRYGYDSKIGQCRNFTFGGCNPNANNFLTQKACEEATAGCSHKDMSNVGVEDGLRRQHVLKINPSDENVVQQQPTPRGEVRPGCLLLRQMLEEGVDQKAKMFCTGPQNEEEEEEAVIVAAFDPMEAQQSLPGSMVCPDADVEVTKDDQPVRLRHNRQEGVHAFEELVPHLV
nr:unnamed protein product [Spirometra erinaceieuropaei]